MELRHIRYFLAVAEERHFTRAAVRLGVSQPPLSLQIRNLEEEIGTPLFRRHPRGVDLTEAGEAFLHHARAMVVSAEQGAESARRAARGEVGEFRLGLSGSTPHHPAVTGLIRGFRSAYPRLQLSIRETHSAALIEALREDSLDAALVLEPVANAEFSFDVLLTEPLRLVLPSDHPFARRKTVELGALAQEPFILVPRNIGPGWHDLVISACLACGFSPRVVQECSRTTSAIAFVAAGLGVTIVPAWLDTVSAPGVTFRPLASRAPRARIVLVHRPDRKSALKSNFLGCAFPARAQASGPASGLSQKRRPSVTP